MKKNSTTLSKRAKSLATYLKAEHLIETMMHGKYTHNTVHINTWYN